MDNNSKHVTANFASKSFKHLTEVVHEGNQYPRVAPSKFDTFDVSRSHFPYSNGRKRRRGGTNLSADPLDEASLFPGFGCLSSSCISMSLGNECEDEYAITLGLSINPRLSIDKRPGTMNMLSSMSKPLISERPRLDLSLSLSTGVSESAITDMTEGSVHFRGGVPAPSAGAIVQHMDEGTISSRWRVGPLVPPLRGTETITILSLDPTHNNPSPAMPGLSSPTTVPEKNSFACASGATPQEQRKSRVKPCQFDGCLKGARGASGFCIAHGGGRRCLQDECKKGAEGKTAFCKAHGGGRRCQFSKCGKSAEGRTDYCIAHGGGRRCSHDGCKRAARGKTGKCIKHGGGKRCKVEYCDKSAEGILSLCIAHGGGRRCQHTGCDKGAQGRTMLCKAHGGGKRCTSIGCDKGAEGTTPFCKAHGGGKRCTFEEGCTKSVHGGTLFCVRHGGGKRCATPECKKSARGRTNFCVRHGGGKRCKYEGCDRSAQGKTDFCKGHGGGTRCSWGQAGFGVQGVAPCDKFARGKAGLCASHNSQADAIQMNVGNSLYSAPKELEGCTSRKMKGIYVSGNNQVDAICTSTEGILVYSVGYGQKFAPLLISQSDTCLGDNACLPQFSLPEGRVHGGSLMAMLRGNTSTEQRSKDKEVGTSLEPGTSHSLPHKS